MFKIVKVQYTNTVTYLLENYNGKILSERSMSTSCIMRLIPTCTLWRKYCAEEVDKVYVK